MVKENKLGWHDLIRDNQYSPAILEYVDVEEMELNCLIATFPSDLTKEENRLHRFSHCEIHPSMILGVSASSIPFSDHNQAPRNTYQSAMGKQAIGIYATDYKQRMDTMANILWYPQIPQVITKPAMYTNMLKLPAGQNVVVAIMCMGDTIRRFNLNESYIDRGLFCSSLLKTIKKEQRKADEKFKRSASNTVGLKPGSYEHLQENGLPKEGSKIKQQEIIIGMVKVENSADRVGNIEFRDISEQSKDGTVDKVFYYKS